MNTYRLSSRNAISTNSSGGKLLKWRIGNKFIKTSTLDTTQLRPVFLYESYAEYIAYRIAHKLNLNIVRYELCEVIIDDSIRTIACESSDFTSTGYNYHSIGKLMLQHKIPKFMIGDTSAYYDICNIFRKLDNFVTQLNDMLIFDALIVNDDRHYGNFGILTSKDACTVTPIFDNGNSLFCHKNVSGIQYNPDLVNLLKSKPFSIFFDTQIGLAQSSKLDISPINKAFITRVLYDTVNKYELPIDRADFIQELLLDRVKYISSMR